MIWNPDGSTAELSGNGTRIAARWLAGRTGAEEVTIRVGPREVVARMLAGRRDRAGSRRGRGLRAASVVDGPRGRAGLGRKPARGRRRRSRTTFRCIGPLLETHPRFPERTNVQVARVDGPGRVTARVWERGVGETLSSGTSAVAVAAATHGEGDGRRSFPGGDLRVRIEDGRAYLTGPSSGSNRRDPFCSQPPVASRLHPRIVSGRGRHVGRGDARHRSAGRCRTRGASSFSDTLQVGRLAPPADDQRARELVRAGRELLRPRAGDDDRPGRHVAAVLDRLGPGDVDDRHASPSARHMRPEHGALADAHALGDDAARADERAVLDDRRVARSPARALRRSRRRRPGGRPRRSGRTSRPSPTCRSSSAGRPRRRCSRSSASSRRLGQERPVARDRRRHDAHAQRRRSRA